MENVKGSSKSVLGRNFIAIALLVLSGTALLMPLAQAEPTGGQVSAGTGTIAQAGATTTITQNTQNLAINWQSFSIGSSEAVRFNQPNSASIALNRVLGQDPSSILGSLSANGQVFVLNPNGVLFGAGSQVNVGGLVASTLSLSDADFMAGNFRFSNGGTAGSVVNQGALSAAQGGYIALLAPEVRNEGIITATLGAALLGAGDNITLNLNNGSLLSYTTDQGSLNALAENRQLIQADGGQVYMSARAADALSTAVVNNTGIIEARTIQNVGGVIKLMGDMQVGTVNVGGTLDASAPNGGNGGFIETSAAHVKIAEGTNVTTAATQGLDGNWLIDPYDFTIAATGGDITGTDLSTALGVGAVTIQTAAGSATCTGATCGAGNVAGNGDIFVNDAIAWTANTTLTLSAYRDVNVNQLIDASVGATGAGSVVLRADNTGNGPGVAAGTVNFTGPGAVALNTGTADIFYNPGSYATPNSYTANVTGGTLNSFMLAFVNNASATAQNKTYDGNTTATLNTPFTFLTGPDGVSAGQLVSLSAGSAVFNSKDVATATTVNFSGYSLGGTDAGLYYLFGQPASQGASITPLALAGTAIAAVNTTYGTPAANGAVTFGNIIGTDNITSAASIVSPTFSTSGNLNAGGYAQTASAIGGTDAANYSFAGYTSAANYTVGQLALTGTITGGGNTYGSPLLAGTFGFGNAIALDSVTSNPVTIDTTGLLSSSSNLIAGTHTGIQSVSATLGGTDAANYTFAGATADYTVGQLALTGAAIAAANSIYGSALTPGTVSFGNVIGSDNANSTASVNTGATSSSGNFVAGNYTQTATTLGGTDAANYSFAGFTSAANYTINQLALTVSGITVDTKIYDGNTSATLNLGSVNFGGIILGDVVSIASGSISGSFTDKNVGSNKTVNLSGVALSDIDAGNYSVTGVGGVTGTITQANLTLSTGNVSKTYDGGLTALGTAVVTGGTLFAGDTLGGGTFAFIDKNVGLGNKAVTTSGVTVGDGVNFGNYNVGYTDNITSTINPQALVAAVIGTTTKVYNGTTAATLAPANYSLTGFIAGEGAAVTQTAGTYNSKDVLAATTVNATLAPTDFTATGATLLSNYTLPTAATGAGAITPAAIANVTGITASNKIYDATTVATLVTSGAAFANMISGDALTVGSATGTFSDKNVATGKTVNISGITLGGADAGNYTLTTNTASTTADITVANIAVTGVTAANKTYDATTVATLLGTAAITPLGSDVVTLGGTGIGSFADPNAGTAKPVTVTGYTIIGTDAANYQLLQPAGLTADITSAIVTLSIAANNASKIYGSTLVLDTITGFTPAGLLGGDTIGSVMLTSAGTDFSANAGSYSIAPSNAVFSSGSASNYTISYVNGTLTVNPYIVNMTGTRAYDGTANMAAGMFTLGPLALGQTLGLSGIGTVADKNVANGKTVNTSGITLVDGTGLASNYAFIGGTQTADITQANLTLSTGNVSKTYDGGLTALGTAVVTGGTLFAGDTLGGGTFAFTDKNVGPGNKTVTTTGVTVGDGINFGNYSVSYADNTTSTINPYAVSMTGTRAYDSTTVVTAGIFTLGPLVGTETLTLSGGGSVSSANAGTYPVTLGTLALGDGTSGGLASNYTFTGGTQNATISAAALAVVTASDASKTYGTDYTLGTTAFTVNGLQGSDNISGVTLTSTGAVSTANVGIYAIVPGNAVFDIGSASNYTISYVNGTLVVNPALLSAAITGAPTKVYNGTTAAILAPANYLLTGFITGEGAIITQTAGTYNSKDVGTAVTVSATLAPTDFTATGTTLLSNYTLPTLTSGAGSITPVALTAMIAASDKVYDGTTTAAPVFSITGGLIGTETVTATGTATFNSKDVLTANLVTADSNLLADGLNGGFASNYSLVTGQTVAANITPAALTATIAAPNKVYDGTTTAAPAFSITGGLIGTETVTATGTATFNSKDVLTANLVTANSNLLANGLNGGLASNYSLVTGQTVAANITAKALTATIAAPSKVYDGNTTAAPVFSITGGLIGTETVTATGTAIFNSKDVLTANLVTADSNLLADGLNGGLASNYSLVTGQTVAANITPKPASITATDVTISYGDALGAGGFTATGLVAPDAIGSVTMTLPGAGTTPDVGVYPGATPGDAVFSAGLSSNYTITYVGGILTVVPKEIKLYAYRPYDTTTIMNASTVGVVNGAQINGVFETLGLTGTGYLLDKNAGYSKPMTLGTLALGNGTNGGKASNYTLVGGQAFIDWIPLSVNGLTAQNKIYDATTAATIAGTATISPLGSDDVTLNLGGPGAAVFNSRNVGNNITVSLTSYALTGADAANYTIRSNQLTANIIRKNISITGTPVATSRVYDGTTLTTISGVTFSGGGLIAGDAAALTGIFTTPNVGVNKFVSVALTGASAGNYSCTNCAVSLKASITPRALTYTGTPVAANRVYDGTTIATIGGISNITGLIPGDGASLVGQFADKNVGTAKPVTLAVAGTDAGNYSFSQPVGLTANIIQRALTLSGTPVALNRPYDSTVIAYISGATINNVVVGDTVNLGGSFANPNVGTAKSVTLALTGKDAGNYSISLPGGLTADIMQRNLVVMADNAGMMFGGSIPPLTYTVGGAGLVGTDSKNTVFSGLLAVNMTGVNPGFTAPITQGTLALTASPGGNYILSSFIDGNMTVQ